MSLTGSFFLDGLVVLAVAAFAAVIWLWPRLSRGTPWHIAGRAGSLVLVNVLVLLVAASQLNAYYLFYTSWNDLAGTFGGSIAQTAIHRGGGEREAANAAVHGQMAKVAADVPALPQPVTSSGDELVYKIRGPRSGLTGVVVVVLPPGYTSTADASERYPVLEALHGYPSAPQSWLKNYPEPQVAQQLASQGHLRIPLLVIPEIEFPPGLDTEGVNGSPGEPQIETWLTRDVPSWVGAHFRVEANRNAWATIGDSAGGYVAAMAALLHPAQYGAGIVLGGYYRPDFGPYYEPFTPDSSLGRRYDLVRAEQQTAPPVSLWIQTSHADKLSYSSSVDFLRAVRRPTSVRAVVLRDAGHRMSVWVALLPQALRWLGQNIQGFEPGGTRAPISSTSAPPAASGAAPVRSSGADRPRSGHARSRDARQRSGGRHRRPSGR